MSLFFNVNSYFAYRFGRSLNLHRFFILVSRAFWYVNTYSMNKIWDVLLSSHSNCLSSVKIAMMSSSLNGFNEFIRWFFVLLIFIVVMIAFTYVSINCRIRGCTGVVHEHSCLNIQCYENIKVKVRKLYNWKVTNQIKTPTEMAVYTT